LLGTAQPHKPLLVFDGAAHATLQAACAVCNLVQRHPQWAPLLAAVGCGEALPCRVASQMGREGLEVRSIAVAERPARSDVSKTNNAAWLCDFAFQFVALQYGTLTCCPRKTARVRRDWLRRRFHRSCG
jgi:hypothetical protein